MRSGCQSSTPGVATTACTGSLHARRRFEERKTKIADYLLNVRRLCTSRTPSMLSANRSA
jgi:hypothetical protein